MYHNLNEYENMAMFVNEDREIAEIYLRQLRNPKRYEVIDEDGLTSGTLPTVKSAISFAADRYGDKGFKWEGDFIKKHSDDFENWGREVRELRGEKGQRNER